MDVISLAIPFYNTSQYFLECIQYALENEFVSEIVVNDDCSDEDQWRKLNQIVDTLNTNKIKLFRNKKNLGAFRNKYITVLNCSNTWVYLLDSDNRVFEDSYNFIKSIFHRKHVPFNIGCFLFVTLVTTSTSVSGSSSPTSLSFPTICVVDFILGLYAVSQHPFLSSLSYKLFSVTMIL